VSDKTCGPYPGWTVKNYYRDGISGDQGHLVWNSNSSQALIWKIDGNDDWVNNVAHGPYDSGKWKVESYFYK